MSVLVNTKNEQEEKVLLAFLNSLNYTYQSDINNESSALDTNFSNQYNEDLENADHEIELGNYIPHDDVEQLFQKRRKSL